MRVDIGDVRLYVDVDGPEFAFADGHYVRRPVIILLHGGPGPDHRSLKLWAEPLTDTAQLVYVDQRGHGLSDRSVPDRWTIDNWADDVARLVEVLGFERPVLLGGSFGGAVAQRAALRHPEAFRSLILLSTAARFDRVRIAATFERLGGPAARDAVNRLYDDIEGEGVFDAYACHCLPLYSRAPGSEFAGRTADAPWNLELAAMFTRAGGEFHQFDHRAHLNRLSLPSLILTGEHDPITSVEAAAEMYAAFRPGVARLQIIEGASHALGTDAPAKTLAAIRAFLEETA